MVICVVSERRILLEIKKHSLRYHGLSKIDSLSLACSRLACHKQLKSSIHLQSRSTRNYLTSAHHSANSMFSSKGLFAGILCPHVETCVLPRCMFMHTRSTTKNGIQRVPGKANLADAGAEESDRLSINNGDSGPRKKRKLSQDTIDTSKIKTPITSPDIVVTKTTPSTKRPVSPPRLKRPAVAPVSKSSASPVVAAKTKPALTPVKTQKAEQLNPRLLQSSPAPHDLRYKLLVLLHERFSNLNAELRKDASQEEECLVLNDQQLIKMALDFEERAAVGKAAIYSQVVKNAIMMYKRMSIKEWKAARVAEMAHLQSKNGTQQKTAKPDPAEPIVTGLNLVQEHAFLQRLLTPVHHLTQHGYVVSKPSDAEVSQAKSGIASAGGWEECDRCTSRFRVFPGRREEDGALTSGGTCVYHWGKPILQEKDPMDPKARRDKKYKCCNQSVGESTGCITASSHVFKISEPKRLASILQFEETPSQDTDGSISQIIKPAICIDGEMGYTVYGLELIRLTATSWPDGAEVLDVLVQPVGEVLDLNSRWSGVWPEQFVNARPWKAGVNTEKIDNKKVKDIPIVSSPTEARKLLYQYITPSTPIIGHGLENDLNALRLIHPTLIDTILLYPHRAGLPIRHGLKALMMQRLGRSIQTANDTANVGTEGGHDSKEDAIAAGELVRLKVKTEWEKLKGQGWTIDSEGTLFEPS